MEFQFQQLCWCLLAFIHIVINIMHIIKSFCNFLFQNIVNLSWPKQQFSFNDLCI